HIDARGALDDRRGEPPHVSERSEIRLEELDRWVPTARPELRDGPSALIRIAPVDQQRCALAREAVRGLLADPIRSAGDDTDSIFHFVSALMRGPRLQALHYCTSVYDES